MNAVIWRRISDATLGLRVSRTLLAGRQLKRGVGNCIGYASQTTEIDFVEIVGWSVIIVVQPREEEHHRDARLIKRLVVAGAVSGRHPETT